MSEHENHSSMDRREFLKKTGIAAAAIAASGLAAWHPEMAYGQQAKGEAVDITAAVRPDWTQGWGGMIIEEKQLWKKYLPKGSSVQFTHPIQGGIVTNDMLANKAQVGYVGDTPAIVATYKRKVGDIRQAAVIGSSPFGYHCNQVIIRSDAPQFKNYKEGMQWLNGKTCAVPKGSCTDRFFREALEHEKVKPKDYLNQPIEVITSNMRVRKIDGAATWEPNASILYIGLGIGRVIANGKPWNDIDSGIMLMRKDFMDKHREAAKGWLKAEIEAEIWYTDPKNHMEAIQIAQKYISGFDKKTLWFSIAGELPEMGNIRDTKPFIFNDDIKKLLGKVNKFLHELKVVPAENWYEAVPDAIQDDLAKEALAEMGIKKLPLAMVKAVPLSNFPG